MIQTNKMNIKKLVDKLLPGPGSLRGELWETDDKIKILEAQSLVRAELVERGLAKSFDVFINHVPQTMSSSTWNIYLQDVKKTVDHLYAGGEWWSENKTDTLRMMSHINAELAERGHASRYETEVCYAVNAPRAPGGKHWRLTVMDLQAERGIDLGRKNFLTLQEIEHAADQLLTGKSIAVCRDGGALPFSLVCGIEDEIISRGISGREVKGMSYSNPEPHWRLVLMQTQLERDHRNEIDRE